MKRSELLTIARMLRAALSYDSREVRIHRLKNSRYLDVRALMIQLEQAGLVQPTSVSDLPTSFTRPLDTKP